ncbi:MAG: response regulator transcription factor [Chloroflexi bacterium]|nr:response regulator transcription factor [Chloroflexota bacterium]
MAHPARSVDHGPGGLRGSRQFGRVLVVDDDPTVRDVVSRYLVRDGFEVHAVADVEGASGILARGVHVDLVILDIVMPSVDGLSFLRELRGTSDVPVILLTARIGEADRIVGLDSGADDYVLKPFSPRELTARVRTLLRRAAPADLEPTLEFNGLIIDPGSRTVTVRGRRREMRAREFDLLAFLAASPRQVFSRRQLLEHVWNASTEFTDVSTVTVHVRRLRQAIENDPLDPRWIVTVRGIGYRFDP